ncbi:MAG TPA: hypothetical protein VFF81_11015 [Noviherbaspirillum sp.]|nr:hypothetical protein [Noviherbaspirillum sp.]
MPRFSTFPLLTSACLAGVLLLTACSPKYDWREVHGSSTPFAVVLPAKPASHTRNINLDGIQVNMTMTAAEVDGVTFAVGITELPDAMQAQKALDSMKTALVRNIGGTIRQEKSSTVNGVPTTEIEASGPAVPGAEQPRLMLARFIAQDRHAYQLVVVGQENAVERDAADAFFTSFKLK